jgi:hypothetical protein
VGIEDRRPVRLPKVDCRRRDTNSLILLSRWERAGVRVCRPPLPLVSLSLNAATRTRLRASPIGGSYFLLGPRLLARCEFKVNGGKPFKRFPLLCEEDHRAEAVVLMRVKGSEYSATLCA